MANYFRWTLDYIFSERRYPYGAFLEDDLFLSDSLHAYFLFGSKVFDAAEGLSGNGTKQPDILSVSAWNDNQREVPPCNPGLQ